MFHGLVEPVVSLSGSESLSSSESLSGSVVVCHIIACWLVKCIRNNMPSTLAVGSSSNESTTTGGWVAGLWPITAIIASKIFPLWVPALFCFLTFTLPAMLQRSSVAGFWQFTSYLHLNIHTIFSTSLQPLLYIGITPYTNHFKCPI